MENKNYVIIEEVSKDIITNKTSIPATDGVLGGVAVTGFVDVEKLIHIYAPAKKQKTIFLEKKLPFSYVVLALEPPIEDGEDGDDGE
jgi:hypothetical protein